MTKHAKSKRKGSEHVAVGGGGAATSAGIRFQQQVGALIGSWLLTERPLDARLDLGESKPEWMRFETEAPVDDILVETSDDGFVAIQAKSSVSLSKNPDSEFGKTVSQFVRHWLTCRNGDGSLNWNRPLDAQLDRLVFAVGPETPATVRKVLPEALRLKSQPGGGQLNAAQQRAFGNFENCVRAAWVEATKEPYSPDVALKLAELIKIVAFDPEGSARESATAILLAVAETPGDAPGILTGIEAVCEDLMAQRGGVDRPALRRRLLAHGTRLQAPQDFRKDIAQLKVRGSETARKLKWFEQIEGANGKPISIVRECKDAIRDAALEDSLLIIGEPGAGKSGVLNVVARDFRNRGGDVLELAVDEHSVESLEGLGKSLGLEHDLIRTLEAWDGTGSAWLVIDGLDASRGGQGGNVFRRLIKEVMSLDGRWKVIASVRTFDLRMGQEFQDLFKGEPPNKGRSKDEFSNVRHVNVPSWTPKEFTQLLHRAPGLAEVMTNAPQQLREIASVPFNTRLLSELVQDGVVTADLSHVGSQAELLQLYWKHRIEGHGKPARACILQIVKCMVEARVLSAQFDEVAGSDPAVLDVLERAGVLISHNKGRRIQFRHHILFDFAAARVLLDPDEMIGGKQKFGKAEALGPMLAPALMFVLQELWTRDSGRADFWAAAAHVLADREGDPVIRSAAARSCAELPERHDDMTVLAERVVAGDEKAAQTFTHVCGALGVRLDDCPHMPLEPWVALVRSIASNVAPVWSPLRFLLFRLIGRIDEQDARSDLGIAARALLAHALSPDGPDNLVPSAINLVADTFSSDALKSRTLLERIFVPDRLDLHAAQEVPALCGKIDKIAEIDPEFAVQIYRQTHGFEITDLQETNMSDSRILALRSNTRQDYGMARYLLKEYFGTFLGVRPDHAIKAAVHAMEAYVDREYAPNPETLDVELHVDGQSVRLREDHSWIWAHDPEGDTGDDAEDLVNKLLAHLRTADEAVAIRTAERIVDTASLAVFWSRLFLAAAEREDSLLDFCLPIAMQQEFLTLQDTKKEAVDVVAKGFDRFSLSERKALEEAVSGFDFSRFTRPDEARASIESLLFGEIGVTNLVTDHAREIAQASGNVEDSTNRRLVEFRMTSGSQDSFHSIQGSDRESPANLKLMAAIERTEGVFGHPADASDGSAVTLEAGLQEMESLFAIIDREAQDASLTIHAEGQISKCIERMVDRQQVPSADDSATTERFLHLFRVAVTSKGPEVDDDTEAHFEKHALWGSPAPRVDAATTVFDFVRQRPDLYSRLEAVMDQLLQDPHPAVRQCAARSLVRILNVDREGFWQRLEGRLAEETNQRVIENSCGNVLRGVVHADAERTEELVLKLLGRFENEPKRQMRKRLAGLIAILWVTQERQTSQAMLGEWIADAPMHVAELSKVLGTLRTKFVAGLANPVEPKDTCLRRRAQEVASEIVAAANAGLAAHLEIENPSDEENELCRNYALLLDAACLQLYFAAKALRNNCNADVAPGGGELETFFGEVGDTLTAIGEFATPRTTHYLLGICEFVLPANPARAFDLVMHSMRSGGQLTGYQFESMGADLLVKLVGLFLADHRELLEDEDRRNALIECLEIFMDAGWPEAQRLLYGLPDLIR